MQNLKHVRVQWVTIKKKTDTCTNMHIFYVFSKFICPEAGSPPSGLELHMHREKVTGSPCEEMAGEFSVDQNSPPRTVTRQEEEEEK